MSTLKVAGGNRPLAARDGGELAAFRHSEISLNQRVRMALSSLREALAYTHDLGCSAWEFAVEISTLRRLQVSDSDLRWLVLRGLIEHGIELTQRDEPRRRFRSSEQTRFAKRSCFVLAPAGVEVTDELLSGEAPGAVEAAPMSRERRQRRRCKYDDRPSPNWDRNRLELRVGLVVVRRYTIPAAHQESILTAFEEEHWPPCIDDPLPRHGCGPVRLRQAIDQLNHGQKQPLIEFFSDRNAQTVGWRYRDRADGTQKG